MSEKMSDDGLAERLYLAWWPPETAAPVPWCDLDEGDKEVFLEISETLSEAMGMRGNGSREGEEPTT
jgi:hypothetical protein